MEKKHLRTFLIGVSAIAGIVCASQAEAKQTCYKVLQNGKALGISDIPTATSLPKKGWSTGNYSCHSSDKKSTLGACSLNWYSASTLSKKGWDPTKLSNLCPSID